MRSPQDVFEALVRGVAGQRWGELPALYAVQTEVTHPLSPGASALRGRVAVRQHFERAAAVLGALDFQAKVEAVHQTADPEVIVGEFAYEGRSRGSGKPFRASCIFVLRVRDGEIVESRDYVDQAAIAAALA